MNTVFDTRTRLKRYVYRNNYVGILCPSIRFILGALSTGKSHIATSLQEHYSKDVMQREDISDKSIFHLRGVRGFS